MEGISAGPYDDKWLIGLNYKVIDYENVIGWAYDIEEREYSLQDLYMDTHEILLSPKILIAW